MGEHKAAVRLVGLRHAKKGSIIAEALEIIDLSWRIYLTLQLALPREGGGVTQYMPVSSA
jgi:hypothetical protein